jgi:molybdopterin synthase catalytic subunit
MTASAPHTPERRPDGGVFAAIVDDPIQPDEVLRRVGDDEDGAVVLFLGTVRNHHEGRAVQGLTYEAYDGMALSVLQELVAKTAEKLPGGRVAAVHRRGELKVGDVAVAVAVSSPHRGPAFDGARRLMDELKRTLPVWKREHYVEGESDWVAGTPIENS